MILCYIYSHKAKKGKISKEILVKTLATIFILFSGMAYLPRLSVLNTFNQVTTYPSPMNTDYIEKAVIVLQKYSNVSHTADCSSGLPQDFPDLPCRFPLNTLGDCQHPDQEVGKGTPCFYLRLNRVCLKTCFSFLINDRANRRTLFHQTYSWYLSRLMKICLVVRKNRHIRKH